MRGVPRLRRTAPALARAGFTLIEVTAAIMIFFLMVTFAFWAMSDAVDQSISSERARQLRMLAERKLGEIAVFERHFDDNLGPDPFDDLPEGMREDFDGWEWQIDVKDYTAFGQPSDDAPALFDQASSTDAAAAGTDTADTSAAAAKKGDRQVTRVLKLTIRAPAEDGEDGDTIEVVTYLPQVVQKAVAGSKSTGDTPK